MHFVEKIVTGAAPYLNVKSQLILTLFGHVLDSLDYQLTFETWRTKFFDLKKKECDICGHSPPDNPPCDNTVRGLLQKLKLPQKKVVLQLMLFVNQKLMRPIFVITLKNWKISSRRKRLPLIESGIVMKWGSSSVT